MEPELLDAVPRDGNAPFDMRTIVEMVMDRDLVFEFGATYGPSQICAPAARPSPAPNRSPCTN